jgi:hypothetical protein
MQIFDFCEVIAKRGLVIFNFFENQKSLIINRKSFICGEVFPLQGARARAAYFTLPFSSNSIKGLCAISHKFPSGSET